MNDLNCPNCGTTYPLLEPGFCGCCDFEFTAEFVNKFIAAEKEKEEQRLKKIEEENRQRQLLIEKAERERRAKEEAERLAKLAREKMLLEMKKEQERIKALEAKDNKRYERDKKFSVGFRKFRNALATFGIVLSILTLVSAVLFSYELDVTFVAPQNVIAEKAETIWSYKMFPVKYDEEKGELKKTWKSEESFDSPQWAITLFNSISGVVNNQSTFEEKISYMFPRTADFVSSFIEKSKNNSVEAPVEPVYEEEYSVSENENEEIIEQNY